MFRYLLETGEMKASGTNEDGKDENANIYDVSTDLDLEDIAEVIEVAAAGVDNDEVMMTGLGGSGFMSLVKDRQDQQKLSIKKIAEFEVPEPEGVCLLADGSIAVAAYTQNAVLRFSKTGTDLIPLESNIGFKKPIDILQLSTGEVVVADYNGLQLFGDDLKFLRTIGGEECNRFLGLAEDSQGRILTINHGTEQGPITKRGHADIFHFTKAGKLVGIMRFADIVSEEMRPKSVFTNIGYSDNKLFIVDSGLDCIYHLWDDDGEFSVDALGKSGDQVGQFDTPAGIVVDEYGNSIVADCNNSRLQLIDSECNIIGPLKVKVNTNWILTFIDCL